MRRALRLALALVLAGLVVTSGQPFLQADTVTAQIVLPNTGPTPGAGVDPRINNVPSSSNNAGIVTPTPTQQRIVSQPIQRPQGNAVSNASVRPAGGGTCFTEQEAENILGGDQSPGGDAQPSCGWDDYTHAVVARNCPEGWICIWDQKQQDGSFFTVMYVGNSSLMGIMAKDANSRYIAGYPPGDNVHESPPCRLLTDTQKYRQVVAGNFSCGNSGTATPTPTGTLVATNTPTSMPTATLTPTATQPPAQPSRMCTSADPQTVTFGPLQQLGPGQYRWTFTLTPEAFQIYQVWVSGIRNAQVDLVMGPRIRENQTGNFDLFPVPDTRQGTITVKRVTPGQVFQANILVGTDVCRYRKDMLGGGPAAP